MGAALTTQAGQFDPLASSLQAIGQNPMLAQGLGNWISGGPGQYEQRAGVPFAQRNVYG